MLELTKDFLDALRTQIEAGRDVELAATMGELHPKDVADIFDALKREETLYLYRLLDSDLKSEVIAELEEDVREELLTSLSSKEIAEDVIEGLDSDDAADALADLPEAKVEEAMRMVDDVESASEVLELLSYEEGTAGALMAVEMVKVEEDWTVARAIREIRAQASDVENIYTIYMVDDQGRLNGRLSLKSLLLNASSARSILKDLKDDDELVTVGPNESEEVVVKLMERYDLVALPVIDDEGMLLGRITIDDAVDVLIEDAERDYQLASGISEDVEGKGQRVGPHTGTFALAAHRLGRRCRRRLRHWGLRHRKQPRTRLVHSAHCGHGRQRRRAILGHCGAGVGLGQRQHGQPRLPTSQRIERGPCERVDLFCRHFLDQPLAWVWMDVEHHGVGFPALRHRVCRLVWGLRATHVGQAQHRPRPRHGPLHHHGE